MKDIPLEDATVGMKLAKPVNNQRGMTLCGAGTELTEDVIARLSKMEVKQITVEVPTGDKGEMEKGLSQQIDELNARFRYVEEDPLMAKIKNMLLERLNKKEEEA